MPHRKPNPRLAEISVAMVEIFLLDLRSSVSSSFMRPGHMGLRFSAAGGWERRRSHLDSLGPNNKSGATATLQYLCLADIYRKM